MPALPLLDARRRTDELTDSFIEDFGRHALGIIPALMTKEQRHAAIMSTANMIRDVDALLDRVPVVDENSAQATQVTNRLTGLRAIAFTVMTALNPDRAWFDNSGNDNPR